MANANANDPVKVGPDSGVQCNLDLVTLNLVTILQRPFFNLLHRIIRFSDIMQFSDSFCGGQKCH